MRLHRAHQFVIEALGKAPDVTSVEPWGRGDHTVGAQVTFGTGSQLWIGVTVAAAPGDKADQPEIPVTDVPPAEVSYPELYEGGKVSPLRAQSYLAAAITNSHNSEVARAYGYSHEAQHPGFGVVFHSGAKAFLLIHHTARAGQGVGGRELQVTF